MKARVCGSVSRCWYTADSDLRSAARSAGVAVTNRAPIAQARPMLAALPLSASPTESLVAPPAACRSQVRCWAVSDASRRGLAISTSNSGHRATFAATYGAPVASPDWRGVSFGTLRSQVQEETIRALGATPVVAFGPDRLLLDLRPQGAERDAAPVRRGEQRAPGADGQPQPFPEHPQAGHVHAGEPGEHPARHGAAEHGVLERVAVDQHRRRQRPQARHSDGVEDPASRPAQIHRPGCGGAHYLGLGVRRPITPLAGDLDLESPP